MEKIDVVLNGIKEISKLDYPEHRRTESILFYAKHFLNRDVVDAKLCNHCYNDNIIMNAGSFCSKCGKVYPF